MKLPLACNRLHLHIMPRFLRTRPWRRRKNAAPVEISNLICRAALGRVCMKLVVVMGVTWIMDVISWAVGGPQEVWYLSDLINCLQGVFIFIVIGCQPQVIFYLLN